MPSVSIKADADEFQRWAVKHANIILRGPGSPHGRVEALKQAALAVASENFQAGKSEGAIEAAQSLGENQESAILLRVQGILMRVLESNGLGPVELAEAVAGEVERLRAAGPATEPTPITDADLIGYMRLTDECADLDGIFSEPATEPLPRLQAATRALCMEVAKLRFQLKAKG